MAKAAAPSQEQLLELMKRAAEELKHAKEEARTAVLALQKEQAAHQKTESELEIAHNAAKSAKGLQSTDEQLLKDQIEAERENGRALNARVKELEAALDGAAAEREALTSKASDSESAVSAAVREAEAKHQKEVEEHEKTIAALKELHEKALEETKREHTEAEAEQKGLLDDAAGNLVQMEQQLAQEREKHQATAQKLLETRAKVRELETALAAEQERVKGLEAGAKQLVDQHEKALRDASQQHQTATADLQSNLIYAKQELASVTERWREVEHQYEALHREMLLHLEQRDEARKQLENERNERERLSKVLALQHR